MGSIPTSANYRKADTSRKSCATCEYFKAGRCTMFDAPAEADYTCDEWEPRPVGKSDALQASSLAEPVHRPLSPSDLRQFGALLSALEPNRIAKTVAKADKGTLYLISHGKTRLNDTNPKKDRVHGWKNTPLDPTGRKQAAWLGQHLGELGIQEIYASDLSRAQQTAVIIGKALKLPVKVSRDYRPWDLGKFSGAYSSQVMPQLRRFMNEAPNDGVDGGESYTEFQKRFLPAFEKLMARVDQGKTVALVTHSRDLELADGWLAGNRKKVVRAALVEDPVEPAEVVEITYDAKRGKWLPKTIISQARFLKADAAQTELRLRIVGVSAAPGGRSVYRMATSDGRYVGRTAATTHVATKGDVLKVQATDFRIDALGDFAWLNPNVVSHYSDGADSWKVLEALAGGEIDKDDGGIPPAGDMGASSAMPSGPTLAAVHVNAPLPNISVAYAGRRLRAKVVKADRMKQIAYGVVLEPNVLDSQDDFMVPREVEKTAHGYLKNAIRGKSKVARLQHGVQGFKRDKPSIVPVESFIAPVDFTYDGKEMIKKGSWVLAMHVEDPALWEDFLNGTYNTWSVGGAGVRQAFNAPVEEVPHGYIAPPGTDAWNEAWSPDGYTPQLGARR